MGLGLLVVLLGAAGALAAPEGNSDEERLETLRSFSHDLPLARRSQSTLGQWLQDPDLGVRRRAAEVLGALGTAATDSVPALIERAHDDEVVVRWSVVEALGRIGDRRADRALIDALSDPAPQVRGAAVVALSAVPGSPVAFALAQALGDPAPEIRRQAANALGARIRDGESATPELIEGLQDPDPDVREAVCLALLAQLRAAPRLVSVQDALLTPAAPGRRELIRLLSQLGRGAAAYRSGLIACATADQPEIRQAAEQLLKQLSAPSPPPRPGVSPRSLSKGKP